MTTVSTGSVVRFFFSPSPCSITSPLSFTSTYLHPDSSSTPRFFITVRWIHPVVLPSPAPSLPFLRWRRYTFRAVADALATCAAGSIPPVVMSVSIPHSFRYSCTARVSTLGAGTAPSGMGVCACPSSCTCVRKSDTSNPMPPAPMTATAWPTGTRCRSTSTYDTTFTLDVPGAVGIFTSLASAGVGTRR